MTTPDTFNLQRFLDAQENNYAVAYAKSSRDINKAIGYGLSFVNIPQLNNP